MHSGILRSKRRLALLAGLIALAVSAPYTFTSSGKLEPTCATGKKVETSTCCPDVLSACAGVGENWYDTGMCGPCTSPYPC